MIKVSSSLLVLGSLLAATAVTASAATITDDVTFSIPFTNGTYGGGMGPGYTTGGTPTAVTGSFTITFDPTMTYTDDTVGITQTSLTGITSDSAFAFDYSPNSYMAGGAMFAPGELVVGGAADGACCVAIDPSTPGNDFYLQILTFSSTPAFQQFGYTTSNDFYFYTLTQASGSVSVTAATAAPEPGSLLLISTGLLGLAIAGRRKRLQLLRCR